MKNDRDEGNEREASMMEVKVIAALDALDLKKDISRLARFLLFTITPTQVSMSSLLTRLERNTQYI